MKYESIVDQRGQAVFPEWTGERVYMLPFFQWDGLPLELARWQPTVDSMLEGIKTDDPIYIMIDQGIVKAGATHRRPGVHIDGYWNPGTGWDTSGHTNRIGAHGNGTNPYEQHRSMPPARPPGHLGNPSKPDYPGNHGGRSSHTAGMHTGHMAGVGGWESATFSAPEAIILASTVTAARGFVGEFEGQIKEGGDCSQIDLSGLNPVIMQKGQVYAGNVTMLHESLPVPVDCLRTLVRLNVPGWHP